MEQSGSALNKDHKLPVRPRILVFCGNGYVFREIFYPIIEEISKDCTVELLMGDYYLTEYTMDLVKRLYSEKKMASYRLVHPYGEGQSLFENHKTMRSIMRSLEGTKIDLLLLITDFYLIDRHLINFAKAQKAKIVITESGTSLTYVFLKYRKMKGLLPLVGASYARLPIIKNIKNDDLLNLLREVREILTNPVATAKRKFRRFMKVFKNHYLFPLLLTGRCFPPGKYDKFAFTAGRGDAVICYDALEAEVLPKIIPVAKNVFLARHPVSDTCRCGRASKGEAGNKLLVMFSGPSDSELAEERMRRWLDAIKRIIDMTGITEVHMRPHPRTANNIKWPNKIAEEVRRFGCVVRMIDPLKEPLPDNICDYKGVLAAPSSAIRTARFACRRAFVITLPDCGDSFPYEQEWCLGNLEGISCIRDREEVGTRHLEVPELEYIWNRPSVADILRAILYEKGVK